MDIVLRFNVSQKVAADWKPSDAQKKNPKVHKYIAAEGTTACHKEVPEKDARWKIDRGSSATQPKISCLRCLNADRVATAKPKKIKSKKAEQSTDAAEDQPEELQAEQDEAKNFIDPTEVQE